MKELTIPLDDDSYGFLEAQKSSVELITEANRSMEDFVSMLIILGSLSLGRAMVPQNESEMNQTVLALMGEAPAEEVPLFQRLYTLMKRRGIAGLHPR